MTIENSSGGERPKVLIAKSWRTLKAVLPGRPHLFSCGIVTWKDTHDKLGFTLLREAWANGLMGTLLITFIRTVSLKKLSFKILAQLIILTPEPNKITTHRPCVESPQFLHPPFSADMGCKSIVNTNNIRSKYWLRIFMYCSQIEIMVYFPKPRYVWVYGLVSYITFGATETADRRLLFWGISRVWSTRTMNRGRSFFWF